MKLTAAVVAFCPVWMGIWLFLNTTFSYKWYQKKHFACFSSKHALNVKSRVVTPFQVVEEKPEQLRGYKSTSKYTITSDSTPPSNVAPINITSFTGISRFDDFNYVSNWNVAYSFNSTTLRLLFGLQNEVASFWTKFEKSFELIRMIIESKIQTDVRTTIVATDFITRKVSKDTMSLLAGVDDTLKSPGSIFSSKLFNSSTSTEAWGLLRVGINPLQSSSRLLGDFDQSTTYQKAKALKKKRNSINSNNNVGVDSLYRSIRLLPNQIQYDFNRKQVSKKLKAKTASAVNQMNNLLPSVSNSIEDSEIQFTPSTAPFSLLESSTSIRTDFQYGVVENYSAIQQIEMLAADGVFIEIEIQLKNVLNECRTIDWMSLLNSTENLITIAPSVPAALQERPFMDTCKEFLQQLILSIRLADRDVKSLTSIIKASVHLNNLNISDYQSITNDLTLLLQSTSALNSLQKDLKSIRNVLKEFIQTIQLHMNQMPEQTIDQSLILSGQENIMRSINSTKETLDATIYLISETLITEFNSEVMKKQFEKLEGCRFELEIQMNDLKTLPGIDGPSAVGIEKYSIIPTSNQFQQDWYTSTTATEQEMQSFSHVNDVVNQAVSIVTWNEEAPHNFTSDSKQLSVNQWESGNNLDSFETSQGGLMYDDATVKHGDDINFIETTGESKDTQEVEITKKIILSLDVVLYLVETLIKSIVPIVKDGGHQVFERIQMTYEPYLGKQMIFLYEVIYSKFHNEWIYKQNSSQLSTKSEDKGDKEQKLQIISTPKWKLYPQFK